MYIKKGIAMQIAKDINEADKLGLTNKELKMLVDTLSDMMGETICQYLIEDLHEYKASGKLNIYEEGV